MKKINTSYNQLLRATSILASSQVATILIRFVRTKALALLLGATGIALIGIYQSLVDLISSFSGLGLAPGAVREVSKVAKEGDKNKLEKVIQAFRHWFTATAVLGTVVCSLSAFLLSRFMFGDGSHTVTLLLLSVCVFFTILTSGRTAILQGVRKISYIAKSNVMGALLGLMAVLGIYYYFGEAGIVPALIINSIIVYACVNFFYRRVDIRKQKISASETFEVGSKALELGVFVTLGACVSALSMFVVRFVLKYYSVGDLSLVGLFESVWIITNVFTGFIISSMGTDYFTRLCTVSDNKKKTQRLVNEQSYLIILVSVPLILVLILFADNILHIQFTKDFKDASEMLKWQMLGVFLKIVATPIASILLAKNKGMLYLVSEVVFFISYLLSCYILIPIYGVVGAGVGYLLSYGLYLLIVLVFGGVLSAYVWNKRVGGMLFVNTLFVMFAFAIAYYTPPHQFTLAVLLLMVSGGFSFYCLTRVFSLAQLKSWFVKQN